MTRVKGKEILGVRVDDVSMGEAAEIVTGWLNRKSNSVSRLVVTVGPEFLVTAQEDEEFKTVLNAAGLSLPDGFGLHLAGVKNRVTGREFMLRLCELSAENGWGVGLLGGKAGVARETASELIKRYPKIKIRVKLDGEEADQLVNSKLPQVDVLFAAFGHPRQEKLLWQLRGQFQVGMGVGGTFDYLSGRVPLPPAVLKGLGLEWLWRVFTQKNRVKRIFRATVVFPLLLLREKFF